MSITLTAAHIRAIGGRSAKHADALASAYNEYAPRFGLDVEHRAEHFLAQLAHESGGFQFYKEIWGPTPAQKRYEGRLDLGNTHPGDGPKYRGYGLIQVTGLANATEFYTWCHTQFPDCPDFVRYPEKIAELPWALLSAFWYWSTRNLNAYADRDDLNSITRIINGGYNGLADRRYRYGLATRAITSGSPSVAPAGPKDALSRPTLRKGSTGKDVEDLQRALGMNNVDGKFGPATQAMVIAFQRKNGLLPDGKVGGLTWAELDKANKT